MEVVVREEVANPEQPPSHPDTITLLVNNTPPYPMAETPIVIVRAEEVLLVVLVLMIWVAAIALFINRWGKIRMLEPYQPKFQQAHRPSCPLAPLSPTLITPQQRMSFSKYNVNCFGDTYSGLPSPSQIRRPRLNSVFVGSSTMAYLNPPRRTKSAMDIQHMVLTETTSPTTSLTGCTSMLPMINYRDRRPSITVDRPQCHTTSKRRPSMQPPDRPLLSHYQQFRNRRASCAATGNRACSSFEQPRRKASITIERPSCSYQGPTISFDTPSSSIEIPSTSFGSCSGNQQGTAMMPSPPSQPPPSILIMDRPKTSRSFEHQPTLDRTTQLPRMAASLDTSPCNASFDRRPSIPEEEDDDEDHAEDVAGPRMMMLSPDDAEVAANAPLLERLKSSDV